MVAMVAMMAVVAVVAVVDVPMDNRCALQVAPLAALVG